MKACIRFYDFMWTMSAFVCLLLYVCFYVAMDQVSLIKFDDDDDDDLNKGVVIFSGFSLKRRLIIQGFSH